MNGEKLLEQSLRATESMDSPKHGCFKKGLKVEVCFDEMDFRSSWHTGTTLETPSKRARKIFIEFDEENDRNKLLREHVNFLLVRPICPRDHTNLSSFKVDAFHKALLPAVSRTAIQSTSAPRGNGLRSLHLSFACIGNGFAASGSPEPAPSDASE